MMEWRARGVLKCPVIVKRPEVIVFIQESAFITNPSQLCNPLDQQ